MIKREAQSEVSVIVIICHNVLYNNSFSERHILVVT